MIIGKILAYNWFMMVIMWIHREFIYEVALYIKFLFRHQDTGILQYWKHIVELQRYVSMRLTRVGFGDWFARFACVPRICLAWFFFLLDRFFAIIWTTTVEGCSTITGGRGDYTRCWGAMRCEIWTYHRTLRTWAGDNRIYNYEFGRVYAWQLVWHWGGSLLLTCCFPTVKMERYRGVLLIRFLRYSSSSASIWRKKCR